MTRIGVAQVLPDRVPEQSLLARHGNSEGYVDCFTVAMKVRRDLSQKISARGLADAFFDSPAFVLENGLLKVTKTLTKTFANARRAVKEDDFTENPVIEKAVTPAKAYGQGVFEVSEESSNEIIMKTDAGTMTWLGVDHVIGDENVDLELREVRLSMGSVLAPGLENKFLFRVLMPFHKMYSRLLLASAANKLLRSLSSERDSLHDPQGSDC